MPSQELQQCQNLVDFYRSTCRPENKFYGDERLFTELTPIFQSLPSDEQAIFEKYLRAEYRKISHPRFINSIGTSAIASVGLPLAAEVLGLNVSIASRALLCFSGCLFGPAKFVATFNSEEPKINQEYRYYINILDKLGLCSTQLKNTKKLTDKYIAQEELALAESTQVAPNELRKRH
jgi:hypothetical protein